MRGKIFKQDMQMFALFGFMLLPIFYLSYTNKLGGQWNINPIVLFILTAAMLLLSFVEIPIYNIRTKKPELSDEKKELLGEFYSVPLADEMEGGDKLIFNTTITLNLGGFILPVILAAYVAFNNPGFAALEIMLIIIVATHLLSEIKAGIGIVIPNYIGLIPIPFALILDPGNTATVVLVSGVLGILIGVITSLFNINENTEGSPSINLGGAGSFKAVYVTVLIAALI
ncbi:MAG: DUF1614 domain-containing protein [ANME-2 cluster archaeon]|nr:DUF1614 domain-containing protein [ANME-2 cluster archaeon]MBC2700285.1 DUF1614 domain-containing protein [ANME-2 cluster archaeon]MBC2708027.1 DUF1614 domain-containing protein [ANME-2 cluster archaeon]MBC2747795.1 DUF1614 domain-containing protein [ANME-2 cluster archaeon]MBC2762310.1 DUF1614 domain-containing protein [ANME-2 cluster archaeon]